MNAYVERVLKGDKVAGVELVINDNGYNLVLALVKTKKGKALTESFHLVNEVQGLAKLIDKRPVALTVSGKGIIHRKAEAGINDTETTLLSKALPNANTTDFYIQQTRVDENTSFISVIRKSQLDALLNDIKKSGIDVVDCSLGPFNINALLSSYTGSRLGIGELELEIENDHIKALKKIENSVNTDINIAGEILKADHVLSFATAINYITGSAGISSSIPPVAESSYDYRQKKIFTIGGYSMLLFFFVLLQANSLLFTHFKDMRDDLESKVTLNKGDLERYTKLKTEYDEKRSFFERAGLLDNTYPSYCADQLAMNIPSTIRLTEMNINPAIKKQVNLEDELSFITKRISVSGFTSKSTDLNEWIKTLNKFSWISKVTLLNYKQDKQKKEAEFNLDIQTK